MRRALITIAVAVAVFAPAAPASAAVKASVRLEGCSIHAHEAVFRARMVLVPGSARMAMRFVLLEETADDGADSVRAPGLGKWRWSKPGVRSFRYRQAFENLLENATYRVRVSFRWYAADGTRVARAKRTSAPCRQFVDLPNLTTQFTRSSETTPGVWRYDVLVRNTGKGAATDVPVRLTVDGDVVDTLTLASLAPGETRTFPIRGPECTRLARLEVDPDEAIAETSDEDNRFDWLCASLMPSR
jgi:CARDB